MIAKCPKCGSTEVRRYYVNTALSATGYITGNMAGTLFKLPFKKFGINAHIEYALGEAGEWLGNVFFNHLVCKKCGTTFPKPENWDSNHRVF